MHKSPRDDRRRLLQCLAVAAAEMWLPSRVFSQARQTDYPFTLGVASGAPTPDGVVLWTRLAPAAPLPIDAGQGPLAVGWEVAEDAGFGRVARSGQAQALPELAHSVHVEVQGLQADQWYFYRFLRGDAVSPVGRTRTLPLPGADVARLRLAYASCQKWEDGHYAAWRHMRAQDPDAVVFLGDYIYEYPGNSGRLRGPGGGWAIDLDGYRRRYAVYKSDADLQAMHQACPWLMTWDDHEVHNDYAGVQAGYGGSGDPSSPALFVGRRNAAYQAYYEHMPLRASALRRALAGSGAADQLRVHERVQFGRLLSLHLLDARQYRDVQVCTASGRLGAGLVNPAQCLALADTKRSLLGWEQEGWLDQSLALAPTRETRWNVLAQQTVFAQRDFRPGPGEIFSNDGWDGYPAARQRLLGSLQRHGVPNPVFLGGDIHANWVAHVKREPDRPSSAAIAVEFCGTSITSRGGGNARLPALLAANPHCVFADAKEHGYGIVDVTPAGLDVRLRAVQDVLQRDTGISTLAAFRVDAGRAALERL